MCKIIISCGGTGGHIAPGIALAEVLIERGHECLLMISQKKIDKRFVKKYEHLNFIEVPGYPFSWKPWNLCRFVMKQALSLLHGCKWIFREKPDLIIGFGGFSGAGIILAGTLFRCPIVLHESNRKLGRAVRFLSLFARRVYLPRGVLIKGLLPKTVRHYGCPVRKEVQRMNQDESRKRLGIDIQGKLLLVLGGSQGAQVLTNWARANFESLAEKGINIYCICGPEKETIDVMTHCSSDGIVRKAYFVPFMDDMAAILSSADFAVSRAGSGSIAEMERCLLPSILIPYPHASNDHQSENGRFVEQQGGGVMLKQQKIGHLKDEVAEILFNEWLLQQFRENLNRLSRDDNLALIADDIEELIAQK